MTCHKTVGFVLIFAASLSVGSSEILYKPRVPKVVKRTTPKPFTIEVDCDQSVDVYCRANALPSVMRESTNGYFSEKLLKNHCRHISEDIDCRVNYTKSCDSESNYKPFILLTNGIKKLFSELCNKNSEISEDYRRYISCFRFTAQHLRYCAFFSFASTRKFQNRQRINANSEIDMKIKLMCSSRPLFRRCSMYGLRNSCNSAAAKYWKKLDVLALQEFLDEEC